MEMESGRSGTDLLGLGTGHQQGVDNLLGAGCRQSLLGPDQLRGEGLGDRDRPVAQLQQDFHGGLDEGRATFGETEIGGRQLSARE